MLVKRFELGSLQANCYLAAPDIAFEAVSPSPIADSRLPIPVLLIDPGMEPAPLLDLLSAAGLGLELILLTHAHWDHLGGVAELQRATGAPLAIHRQDAPGLVDPWRNLSTLMGVSMPELSADRVLEEGDLIEAGRGTGDAGCGMRDSQSSIRSPVPVTPSPLGWHSHPGPVRLQVIHTPGHTPGSACFQGPGCVFTGDCLFAGGVGRTDFPGGSEEQIFDSIRRKLLVLPDDTVIYPGHGPPSTIGQERRSNPSLAGI